MVNLITGNRLPTFTDEEAAMVKGSFDFIGLNHYTTKYVKYTGIEGRDFMSDGRYTLGNTDVNGNLIGP